MQIGVRLGRESTDGWRSRGAVYRKFRNERMMAKGVPEDRASSAGARRPPRQESNGMQVLISGRHMSVSGEVKAYCQEKAEKLTRFYDRVQSVEVILDGQSGVHTAEMIVHADRTDPFIAQEQHADLHAAIDVVADKVERQLATAGLIIPGKISIVLRDGFTTVLSAEG